MNVRTFRNTLKQCLDAAAQGKTITVERGGLVFELTATNHIVIQPRKQVINKLPTRMPETLKEANDPDSPGYSAKVSPDIVSTALCKIHGTPLGTNSKCLQKGCKYA